MQPGLTSMRHPSLRSAASTRFPDVDAH
jgi:hypothetical protein